MKNKTLCLYYPQYDRVLNINKNSDGTLKFEIRANMKDNVYTMVNKQQIKELKAWIVENDL